MGGMQFGSISLMILFDWVGGSEQSLLRTSVYSLVYAFVTVGLVTLWRSGEKFAFILNAVNQLPISMKTIADITPLTTKRVRSTVLSAILTGWYILHLSVQFSYYALKLQLSRNAAVATVVIILYTLVDLLTYYTHFYKGFYKGLEHYLKPLYNIFRGKNNCSLLTSDDDQDGYNLQSFSENVSGSFIFFPFTWFSGCEVPLGAVALAILMWISEGVTQYSHLFLNLLCFVHADTLLYFVHTLLAHTRLGGNRGSTSSMIRVEAEL